MTIQTLDKATLRKNLRAQREALDDETYARLADAINERLAKELTPSEIAVYSAIKREPFVDKAIKIWRERHGCITYYPRVESGGRLSFARVDDPDDLVPGRFGLLEPRHDAPRKAISEIGAALVPGLAFDMQGTRLGFGGGYYDRAFEGPFRYPPILIGVGFDWQIVPEIPREHHDIAMSWLITDERMVECRKPVGFSEILTRQIP